MQRNDTMFVKNGRGYSPVTVIQVYAELPAVRVKKGVEEWILKQSELVSSDTIEKEKKDKREAELKEKYRDFLAVYVPGDTHLTIAEKLGCLPVVAHTRIKHAKNHGLI